MAENVNLSGLSTEQRNPATMNIDDHSAAEIVKIINDGDRTVADAVSAALPFIARAAEVENFAKYVPEESTQKEEYIERKKKGAEIRRIEKRKAEVAREIKKLEQQLIDIDDELFGDAASDYVRAAELTDLKTTTEDRLMQLYAEEEELNEG